MAISAWNWLGVVTETTSTSGSSMSRRQSAVAFSKPNSSAREAASSALASARCTSLGRATSPKTVFTAFQASAWHLPIYPVPIKPTPNGFITIILASYPAVRQTVLRFFCL
jgi:hypothetical protein